MHTLPCIFPRGRYICKKKTTRGIVLARKMTLWKITFRWVRSPEPFFFQWTLVSEQLWAPHDVYTVGSQAFRQLSYELHIENACIHESNQGRHELPCVQLLCPCLPISQRRATYVENTYRTMCSTTVQACAAQLYIPLDRIQRRDIFRSGSLPLNSTAWIIIIIHMRI